MQAYDHQEFSKHQAEAKEKWGNTAAYQEFEAKRQDRSAQKQDALAAEMDQIMAEFAQCMASGQQPDSAQAQACVQKLQAHITAHYYHCTNQILFGLGQMYVADARFQANIDRHAPGNAAFIRDAIGAYCQK